MSILISGDIHGDSSIRRVKLPTVSTRFADWETIRYLIVVGDWGAIWNDSAVSIAQEKKNLPTDIVHLQIHGPPADLGKGTQQAVVNAHMPTR